MRSTILMSALLLSNLIQAQYVSPDSFLAIDMEYLAENSNGAVVANGDNYEVYEDLTISLSDTLIVTDKVVLIDEGVLITIEGGFYSNETVFSQLNCCDSHYDGFRLESSSVVEISNSSLNYGGGVNVLTANFSMESSTISHHATGQTTGAALDLTTGKPKILDCTFEGNQVAAIGSAANASVAPIIEGCTFSANVTENSNRPQVNLGPSGSDTTLVIDNIFTGDVTNTMVGGFAFSLLAGGEGHLVFSNNSLSDNRYGMTVFGANVTSLITDNSFENNNTQNEPLLGGSGISISGFGDNNHVILNNFFSGNLWGITLLSEANANLGDIEDSNLGPGGNSFGENGNGGEIYALFNNTENTILAQGNCWDITQEDLSLADAENVISHAVDDPELGEVIFDPLGPCILTAHDEDLNRGVIVYPNPAVDRIILESDNHILAYEILDLNGVLIESGQDLDEGSNELELKHFSPGVYLLRIFLASDVITKKLYIQH